MATPVIRVLAISGSVRRASSNTARASRAWVLDVEIAATTIEDGDTRQRAPAGVSSFR
jgi:hypothetical protein